MEEEHGQEKRKKINEGMDRKTKENVKEKKKTTKMKTEENKPVNLSFECVIRDCCSSYVSVCTSLRRKSDAIHTSLPLIIITIIIAVGRLREFVCASNLKRNLIMC